MISGYTVTQLCREKSKLALHSYFRTHLWLAIAILRLFKALFRYIFLFNNRFSRLINVDPSMSHL